MKIGKRLTLQFTLVVGLIFVFILTTIYILVTYNSQSLFYERLKDRAYITANIFFEKDELSAERIEHFERNFLQSLADEYIQILNDKNKIIYSTDAKPSALPNDIIENLNEKHEFRYTKNGRQYLSIKYHDNQGNFIIIVSAINKTGVQKTNYLLLVCALSFLFSLIIIYLAGKYFSKKALTPITEVVDQVKNITLSNLNLRVSGGKNKDEIAELADTFNNMLQRLQNAFEIEKNFISNASHELRNPLTAIIGELQVLLSKEREKNELEAASSVILERAVLMKELVNSLLLLSQMENAEQLNINEDIRIDELLIELTQNTNTKHAGELIKITFINLPENQQELIIKGNRLLLYAAMVNLIENGIKFSHQKQVDCILRFNKNQIEVEICDKGIGILEKDLNQLFHPFFRGDNAREFNGNGIGLSLSHKILTLHKATIYARSDNDGTTFSITFNKN